MSKYPRHRAKAAALRIRASNLDPLGQLLARSGEVFLGRYDKDPDPSILWAYKSFDKHARNGLLPIPDAEKILNDLSMLDDYLDAARDRYNGRMYGVLESIKENTSTRNTVLVAATVGTVFCLLSPFVAAWLQPTADGLFHRSASEVTVRQASVVHYGFKDHKFHLQMPETGAALARPFDAVVRPFCCSGDGHNSSGVAGKNGL